MELMTAFGWHKTEFTGCSEIYTLLARVSGLVIVNSGIVMACSSAIKILRLVLSYASTVLLDANIVT
jgi:hypothetical protein